MTDPILHRLVAVDDGRWTWLGVREEEARVCTVVTDERTCVLEVSDGAPPLATPAAPRPRGPVHDHAIDPHPIPAVQLTPAPVRPAAAVPSPPTSTRLAAALVLLLASTAGPLAVLVATGRGTPPVVATRLLLAGLAAAIVAAAVLGDAATRRSGALRLGLRRTVVLRRGGRRDHERGVLQEV